MITRDIFARRSYLRIIGIFSLSILFTMQLSAENKALKDKLEHSLSGTTLISTILVGGRAIPRGYKADYPVNTLVDPDSGAVTYRVEGGVISTEVATREMQRYFDRGTSFHVSSIELKDEWLEIKMESAKGDPAQLNLMLGSGWQSKYDGSSVQAQLARVFVFDQKPQSRQIATVPVGFGEMFSPAGHAVSSNSARAVGVSFPTVWQQE